MCLGPVNGSATLGERLLQKGVISAQGLQETLLAIADAPLSETRMAITLMELGHVEREALRAWAAREASDMLQVILTWPGGELYFEEEIQPPSDRLLVALSVTSLLPASAEQNPASQPAQTSAASAFPVAQAVSNQAQAAPLQAMLPDVTRKPTLVTPSQFFAETSLATQTPSASLPDSPLAANSFLEDMRLPLAESQTQSALPQLVPVSVAAPQPPRRIDTSFLRPDMVLVPVDFSAIREENRRVQITPDQWRLLTRVDGRTTLQKMCTELTLMPPVVCQLAGELIAEGLVYAAMPAAIVDELSPVSREMLASGLGNGYVTPGAAAQVVAPYAAITPTTDALSRFGSPASPLVETQSQWGNGGNGATFVPGRGWVTGSQPLPRVQVSGQLYASNDAYASARALG